MPIKPTKRNLLFLLVLLCASVIGAQDYAVTRIPLHLFKDAAVVVRTFNTDVEIETLEKITVDRTYTITLLNESGEPLNIMMGRNSSLSKCKTLSAKLFDADGKLIRKNDKAEVKQHSGNDYDEFADGTTQYVSLKHHSYPYTVEYTIREEYASLMYLPNWSVQGNYMSVEQSKFRLKYPKKFGIRAKLFNLDVKPLITSLDEDTDEWFAEVNALPAITKKQLTKQSGFYRRYAHFVPKYIKIKDVEGASDTWNQFGKIVYELNKDRDQLTTGMQWRVKEMTSGLTSDKAKIDTLYEYLKSNYRYVSVQIAEGGWQTFPADYVEKKKYGDCKALSNYMKAMLKVAGINSYVCLVEGRESAYFTDFDQDYPYDPFNHVILYVPSEDLWLECTSSTLPSGYLGRFTQNRHALLLTPEGGVLKPTPTYGAETNKKNSHTKIEFEAKADFAKLKHHQVLEGKYAESWYTLVATETDEQTKKDFAAQSINLITSEFNQLHISTDSKSPCAKVQMEVVAKYANRFGNRINIPLHKLNAFELNISADTMRSLNVWSDNSFSWLDTVSIQLPDDFLFEAIPEPSNFSGAYGSYTTKFIKTTDQNLVCIRELKLHPIDAPASEYETIRAWLNKLRQADLESVVAVQLKRP